jgi:hypothetical protein
METKGVGQQGMEKCLGRSQGPNWDVKPSAVVVAVAAEVAVAVAIAAASSEVVAAATD